jgi:hypothetical protein
MRELAPSSRSPLPPDSSREVSADGHGPPRSPIRWSPPVRPSADVRGVVSYREAGTGRRCACCASATVGSLGGAKSARQPLPRSPGARCGESISSAESPPAPSADSRSAFDALGVGRACRGSRRADGGAWRRAFLTKGPPSTRPRVRSRRRDDEERLRLERPPARSRRRAGALARNVVTGASAGQALAMGWRTSSDGTPARCSRTAPARRDAALSGLVLVVAGSADIITPPADAPRARILRAAYRLWTARASLPRRPAMSAGSSRTLLELLKATA